MNENVLKLLQNTKLQISTAKLQQKFCSLDFTTADHGILQIVVLFRGLKYPWPAVVYSRGFISWTCLQQIVVNFVFQGHIVPF